jgi:hypothetical protein
MVFHVYIFGKSCHLKSCGRHLTRKCKIFQSKAQPMNSTNVPPEWLIRWRRLVERMMGTLFLPTLRSMSRMVGMGLAPRTWLTMLEQQLMMEEDRMTRQERVRPLPALCTHPEFRRYGNKSG